MVPILSCQEPNLNPPPDLIPPVLRKRARAVFIPPGYDLADLVRLVYHMNEHKVLGRNGADSHGVLPEPVQEAAPVLGADEDHGEAADLFGLDERERLEQFIKGAETAREDHVSHGVFHEHELAHEEVTELDLD